MIEATRSYKLRLFNSKKMMFPNVKVLRILILFCAISGIGSLSFAQDAPKYSNEFLAVGVGARALGMGNAFTAVTNDVTSGYWNPAGLLGVRATCR